MNPRSDYMKEKEALFNRVITNWNKANEYIYGLEKLVSKEGDGNSTMKTEKASEIINDVMLAKVKEIMEIPANDTTIYDDEWFWLEWTPTSECFWYVFGKTQNARQTLEHNNYDGEATYALRHGQASFANGWLMVWRGNYEPKTTIIKKGDGIEYFAEAKGFDPDEITEILTMEEGDVWQGDANGLYIFR